jgi:tetratricopeptide (TPR) repeat protein
MGGAMQQMESDEVLLPAVAGRRRMGGWVVALFLLVGVLVIGFMLAKPYLKAARPASLAAAVDPRAADFLKAGEAALADGDFETASEKFVSASVVAEKDPRVLLDKARLAAARADVKWLEMRLLDGPAADDAKKSLDELARKARAAAEDANTAAAGDPDAIRARIDALRINGEREGARMLVARIIQNASQPETAYVLAGLDLAEPEPLYKTVIERLRVAVQGEGSLGRARAALVFALARSGDQAGAKAELDKLAALPRPHPLTDKLRAFLDKSAGRVAAAKDAGPTPSVDVTALKSQSGSGSAPAREQREPREPREPGPPLGTSGDPKVLVQQAHAAQQRGDLDTAARLYGAALDKNPSDSEAHGGLGDIARARGDLAGARVSYQNALRANPQFLPAKIGLADVLWASGDKAGAQKMYKDIVDTLPEGAYPAHVKNRASESLAPAAPAAPTASDPK